MGSTEETDSLPPDKPAKPGRYLTFLLGGERLAVSAEFIRGVIGFSSLTDVPLMPDFLRGVVNVRGAVLPVIDLALRLGLEETPFGKRTCVVILELQHDEQTVTLGVLVDVAQAVLTLDMNLFEALEPPHPRIGAEFIEAALERDEGRLIVLDLNHALDLEALVDLIGDAGFRRIAALPRSTKGAYS